MKKTQKGHHQSPVNKFQSIIIDDLRLLAGTIMLVDKTGIVRYIQIVTEITGMPDKEKGFAVAIDLSQ